MASQKRNFLLTNHLLVFFQSFMVIVLVLVTAYRWRRSNRFSMSPYGISVKVASESVTLR
jgi:hypothetical protein